MTNTVLMTRIETAIRACPDHRECSASEFKELVGLVAGDITAQASRPPRTLPADIAKAFGTRNQGVHE